MFVRIAFKIVKGVAFVVGVVGAMVAIAFGVMFLNPIVALPINDTLRDSAHVFREWDDSSTRASYVPDGYELAVKRAHEGATSTPNVSNYWYIRVEVTAEFRPVVGAIGSNAAAPTLGVICSADANVYDVRVGLDGHYAAYRWDRGSVTELASNVSLGKPPLSVTGPMRLVVECQRRDPTTVRLRVNGVEVLSVTTDSAKSWGQVGLIVQSGASKDVAAVFRDIFISGS